MLTDEKRERIRQYLRDGARLGKGISLRFLLAAMGVIATHSDRRGRVGVTSRQATKLCGMTRQAIRYACRRRRLPYEMGHGVYSVPHYLIPVANLLAYQPQRVYHRRTQGRTGQAVQPGR